MCAAGALGADDRDRLCVDEAIASTLSRRQQQTLPGFPLQLHQPHIPWDSRGDEEDVSRRQGPFEQCAPQWPCPCHDETPRMDQGTLQVTTLLLMP